MLPGAKFTLRPRPIRSAVLAPLLHGTRAVGVIQTLRRGTRNGITELPLVVIYNRGRHHLYSEGGHHVEHSRIVVFSEYAIARPSVVCLSSVTFVRPTQAVQIFGNISTELGTLAID